MAAMGYLHKAKIRKIVSVSTTKKGPILQQNDIFSRRHMGQCLNETRGKEPAYSFQGTAKH